MITIAINTIIGYLFWIEVQDYSTRLHYIGRTLVMTSFWQHLQLIALMMLKSVRRAVTSECGVSL